MERTRKKRLAFALAIGLGLALATWLFNFLDTLTLPAVILGAIVSGNIHQVSPPVLFLALFLQWFVLGYLLSLVIFRRGPTHRTER